MPLDEYLEDDILQAAVERRLQLAIQVCMDITNYIIAQQGLRSSTVLENIFEILGHEGILTQELSSRMVGMVRFRNILVHDYLEIDPSRVYSHLTAGIDDFKQFASEITEQFFIDDIGDTP